MNPLSHFKTPESFLGEISRRSMTPAEVFEQRVSFVFGQLGHANRMSKEQVRETLRRQGFA